ncbi:MAG: VanZ family protein [Lachnospiraceae bacterium]|nr:VanZ family protein [Lachnospiraceae bacterium]
MKQLKFLLKIVLATAYIVVLYYLLFAAESLGRGGGAAGDINLIPFHEIKRYINHVDSLGLFAVVANLLGNVVLFMPLGYFLPSFFARERLRPHFTIPISMCISIAVEVSQFMTGTGSMDIDDVILNTLGGIIGYLVYAFMHPDIRDGEYDDE